VGNRSIKLFVDLITTFLLENHAKGRRAVVIIDEAQNLHPTVLEQVRLLTNLETSERKLLQIIMLGQPELLHMLDQPEMRQISQRITARYHLEALSRKELGSYVNHRLAVAGLRAELFPPGIVRRLYRLSGGIPRLTNVICDRALLGTYVQGHTTVKRRTLAKAASEVLGQTRAVSRPRPFKTWWVAASLALMAGVFVLAMDFLQHRAVPVESPADVVQLAPLPEKDTAAPEAANDNSVPAQKSAPTKVLPGAALVWPAGLPIAMSQTMAFRALLARWGNDFALAEHDDVCQYARRYGLACLSRQGSLDSLIQYNVPAVLLLADDQGQDYYAALVALRGDAASLVVGAEGREVTTAALQENWLGEFTLLWRPPPGYQMELTEGRQGTSVKWLKERLAVVQGRQLPSDGSNNQVFDAGLKSQVEAFQLAQGLKADGIAGPQTLMRLSAFSDPGAPVLVAPDGGQ
jgi:general secretion pathway protein A